MIGRATLSFRPMRIDVVPLDDRARLRELAAAKGLQLVGK
jgi:hypothetical protein